MDWLFNAAPITQYRIETLKLYQLAYHTNLLTTEEYVNKMLSVMKSIYKKEVRQIAYQLLLNEQQDSSSIILLLKKVIPSEHDLWVLRSIKNIIKNLDATRN